MTTTCDQVTAELSELVDGDREALARCAEHLAGCEACRDARHDATQLVARVAAAGADHAPSDDLAARVLAALAAADLAPAVAPPAPRPRRPRGSPRSRRRSPASWWSRRTGTLPPTSTSR